MTTMTDQKIKEEKRRICLSTVAAALGVIRAGTARLEPLGEIYPCTSLSGADSALTEALVDLRCRLSTPADMERCTAAVNLAKERAAKLLDEVVGIIG